MPKRLPIAVFACVAFFFTYVVIWGRGQEKSILVVMPLQVLDGITQSETIQITQFIEHNILQTKMYDLVERTLVDKMLKDSEFRPFGHCDVDCAVRIAKQMSAKKVVIGTAGKLGSAYNIQLKLIDVETNRLERSSYVLRDCRLDELPNYMSDLVRDLLGPPGTQVSVPATPKDEPAKGEKLEEKDKSDRESRISGIPVIKATPAKRIAKKRKFPWLIVGGLALGAAAAVILLTGKKNTLFTENWDSGAIDTTQWAYIDDVIPSHGGHKASVVNGALFINGLDDWTQGCGIIMKKGFGIGTRLTVKFKIEQIVVYNDFQGFLVFYETAGLTPEHYQLAPSLFSLCGGNDNIRDLFIYDDAAQIKYPLGNYTPGTYYTLEIMFESTQTRFSANGHTVTLPKSFPSYHLNFGCHVTDSYFDDLIITRH